VTAERGSLGDDPLDEGLEAADDRWLRAKAEVELIGPATSSSTTDVAVCRSGLVKIRLGRVAMPRR
jgi:hypothetical protein